MDRAVLAKSTYCCTLLGVLVYTNPLLCAPGEWRMIPAGAVSVRPIMLLHSLDDLVKLFDPLSERGLDAEDLDSRPTQ